MDTPDLKWDSKLAVKAQKYADKLVAKNKKSLKFYIKHSTGRHNIGENLYWKSNQKLGTCAEASQSW